MAAVVEKGEECKLFGRWRFPNGVPELTVDVVYVLLFGIEYGMYVKSEMGRCLTNGNVLSRFICYLLDRAAGRRVSRMNVWQNRNAFNLGRLKSPMDIICLENVLLHKVFGVKIMCDTTLTFHQRYQRTAAVRIKMRRLTFISWQPPNCYQSLFAERINSPAEMQSISFSSSAYGFCKSHEPKVDHTSFSNALV